MEKNYKKIDFLAGNNIEKTIIELMEYNERGELVCGSFNGHMLYSDNVTVDGAYLEIHGKTKAEWDKEQEERRENYRLKEEVHKSQISELTKDWIEKGHKILSEKYWVEWDKYVPIRLGDLYRGMELECCLNIVKPLNNGCSLDVAKEIIEGQDHSGMSFSLVRAMVKVLCDRGEEFATYVS